MAQTTLKTNHVIAISPVHWRADCYLETSYKHSSYYCVTLSEKVLIAPLPGYTRYNIKIDLREIGGDGMDWIDLAQDRDQ
jgi:hypothetical protein